MLRKLIALAITSGLAKKAWDHYRQTNAKPAGMNLKRSGRKTPMKAARAVDSGPSAR